MEANELRIENLVNHISFGISAIKGINQESLKTQYKNNEYWDDIVQLQAISLTEDWLLKLGYKPYQGHYIISGHLVWVCNDLFMCNKNGIILKYVHQLQNLYFALTNNELIIK